MVASPLGELQDTVKKLADLLQREELGAAEKRQFEALKEKLAASLSQIGAAADQETALYRLQAEIAAIDAASIAFGQNISALRAQAADFIRWAETAREALSAKSGDSAQRGLKKKKKKESSRTEKGTEAALELQSLLSQLAAKASADIRWVETCQGQLAELRAEVDTLRAAETLLPSAKASELAERARATASAGSPWPLADEWDVAPLSALFVAQVGAHLTSYKVAFITKVR